MIVSDFINTMSWQKPLKAAVLTELCKVNKLELFDLYSADIELNKLQETAVAVVKKMYNKNKRDISKLYNTYTPHKTILTLSDQNYKAYQNELKRINNLK